MIDDHGRHTAIGQNGLAAISDEGKGLGESGSKSREETGSSSDGELHYDSCGLRMSKDKGIYAIELRASCRCSPAVEDRLYTFGRTDIRVQQGFRSFPDPRHAPRNSTGAEYLFVEASPTSFWNFRGPDWESFCCKASSKVRRPVVVDVSAGQIIVCEVFYRKSDCRSQSWHDIIAYWPAGDVCCQHGVLSVLRSSTLYLHSTRSTTRTERRIGVTCLRHHWSRYSIVPSMLR